MFKNMEEDEGGGCLCLVGRGGRRWIGFPRFKLVVDLLTGKLSTCCPKIMGNPLDRVPTLQGKMLCTYLLHVHVYVHLIVLRHALSS